MSYNDTASTMTATQLLLVQPWSFSSLMGDGLRSELSMLLEFSGEFVHAFIGRITAFV